MAFIPQISFLPGRNVYRSAERCKSRRHFIVASSVKSKDGMEFFRHREGTWQSWRVTHHLAFRRSESGESVITMQCLDKSDERIQSLCRDWEVNPEQAEGGCYVTWRATMAWDQEGENHEGSTVFALVPDEDNIRKGKILRDRGYAEIVPIAGTYYLDEQDDLNLDTPYDGGAVEERFSFDGPNTVNRTSTVRRFGGFSTATLATERRVEEGTPEEVDTDTDAEELLKELAFFSQSSYEPEADKAVNSRFLGAKRFATTNTAEKPSQNSAFGSGFGGKPMAENGNDTSLKNKALDAANKAGIDLSKIPPSMRDDFAKSFDSEADRSS